MTHAEQKCIINSLTLDEKGAVALSARLEKWAEEQFRVNGEYPRLGSRGICVQFRTENTSWEVLKYIYLTRVSWETRDDRRSREEDTRNLFYWQNMNSSNKMGDVTAVRYMPFIDVDDEYRFKEDEIKEFKCTDTYKRRKWNHLDFHIYTEPSGGVRGYSLIRPDMHKGANISWYESWHFSLEDDAECPVAPIVIEDISDYQLVLRYRDRLYTLSMDLDKPHTVHLEEDVPVKPTHNWDSIWMRPPYTFTLVLTISWKETIYASSDRENFHNKPHFVLTSDLPEGVRTMQQIDHDAWEEAARSGR